MINYTKFPLSKIPHLPCYVGRDKMQIEVNINVIVVSCKSVFLKIWQYVTIRHMIMHQ